MYFIYWEKPLGYLCNTIPLILTELQFTMQNILLIIHNNFDIKKNIKKKLFWLRCKKNPVF